jgi:hypothetical protein
VVAVGSGYPGPSAPIPACGFPAPGSCRRSNAIEAPRCRRPVQLRLTASWTCRALPCVRGMRRCSPSLRSAAFPPPSPPPTEGRRCSRLHRYYAAVRLLASSPGGFVSSRFCELYWGWASRISVTIRQTYAGGDKLVVNSNTAPHLGTPQPSRHQTAPR